MKIGILVDSSATCQPELFKDTVIEWIPLHITYLNEIDILDTTENINKYKVFERIEQDEEWKTSQASPGELENKYDAMLSKYDHIVHIPITENLSSMMSTAMMVANEERYKGKVTIIHNKTVAAQGIKEIALHLSELIKNDTLKTASAVVKEFNHYSHAMYIALIPSDLKKLASGGRAVKIISTILNMFKTKTLIRWKEKPEKEAMGRTISGLMEKVIRNVEEGFNGTYHFILTSSPMRNEKNRQAAIQVLKENNIQFVEEPIPHLYPVHAGVETIGFIVTPFINKK